MFIEALAIKNPPSYLLSPKSSALIPLFQRRLQFYSLSSIFENSPIVFKRSTTGDTRRVQPFLTITNLPPSLSFFVFFFLTRGKTFEETTLVFIPHLIMGTNWI